MFDPFPWLTEARLAHRDFYTGLPVEAIREYIESLDLSEEEKAQALASIGQPSVKMTCPVCGQPSTHLVLCKGCGGGSFDHLLEGWDWDNEPNPPLLEEAQAAFREAMSQFGEAAEHAARRVYYSGGCMICEHCWDGTLVNWHECPVRLFEDAEGWVFLTMMAIGDQVRAEGLNLGDEGQGTARVIELFEAEVSRLIARWCEGWNWGQGKQKEAIARWRRTLFNAAMQRHWERLERRRKERGE